MSIIKESLLLQKIKKWRKPAESTPHSPSLSSLVHCPQLKDTSFKSYVSSLNLKQRKQACSLNVTPNKSKVLTPTNKIKLSLFSPIHQHKKVQKNLLPIKFEKMIHQSIEMLGNVKKISFEYKQNNYAKRLSEFVNNQRIRVGFSNVDDVLEEVKQEQAKCSKNEEIINKLKCSTSKDVLNALSQRAFSQTHFHSSPKSDDIPQSNNSNEIEYIKLDYLIRKLTLKHSLKNDLLNALQSSNLSKTKRILDKNPFIINELLCMQQTPLQVAAKIGNPDIIALLISKGADISHRDIVIFNNR